MQDKSHLVLVTKNPSSRRRSRGAAVIEFALLLPILITLLVGIVEFGVALYDKAVLTNAAREGARTGVLRRESTLTNEELHTLVTKVVDNYCEDNLITFDPSASNSKVTVTTQNEEISAGEKGLRVRIHYVYTGLLLSPFFGTLSDPITLTSEAVMRYE